MSSIILLYSRQVYKQEHEKNRSPLALLIHIIIMYLDTVYGFNKPKKAVV